MINIVLISINFFKTKIYATFKIRMLNQIKLKEKLKINSVDYSSLEDALEWTRLKIKSLKE